MLIGKEYYNRCKENLSLEYNDKQKFQIGDKVKVAKDLGKSMAHFQNDYVATIEYTYSQMYGGNIFDEYSLIDENGRTSSWYCEWQLTKIK